MKAVLLRASFLGFLMVLAPGVAAHVVDDSVPMSDFPIDDNYVAGYVVWTDGKVSIAWRADAPTDPQGGPTPTGAATTYKIDSQPTPTTFYLNVTRTIEILFFVKDGVGGPTTDTVIKMGSTIVGGTVYDNAAAFSDFVEGYTSFNVRVQSEVLIIPKDSVLTIEYSSTDQGRFKVAGATRSLVRFPVLGPTERILRYPEVFVNADAPATAEADATPLVGLLVLAPAFRSRRRPERLWVVATVALSGCMGGGSGWGATSPSTQTSTDDTGLANGTMGAIVGLVSDKYANPLRDVFISVLHAAPYTRSDINGAFSLRDVPPGERVVRFEKEGFLSLEAPLTVEAGKVARMEASLAATDPAYDLRMAGRHPHDMWGADKEKVIYQGDINVHSSYSSGTCNPTFCRSYCQGEVFELGGTFCPYPEPVAHCESTGVPRSFCAEDFYIGPGDDPKNPVMILPGTQEVEVEVSWNVALSTVTRVGVGFQANHLDPFGSDGVNWTMMYPRATGSSVHIATSPDMTDKGHQGYSTWQFRVYLASRDAVLTLQNPLTVTVTIHKGNLPLEPAHRDFWKGSDTLTVMDAYRNQTGIIHVFPDPSYGVWEFPNLVPPETTRLDFVLTSTAATPTYDWRLLYKAADTPPSRSGDFSRHRSLGTPETTGETRTFHLDVNEYQVD